MAQLELEAEQAQAAGELARLQARVKATRALLARLTRDVAPAEGRDGNGQAARLLEATEQLAVSAVRAQAEAEATERTLSQVSLAAKFDPLTDLPNRMLLLDRFTVAIANATRHRTRLALLFLDLNNFKQINDTFGHPVGDQVLRRAASCLASSVRAGDTVSRHGGDEFLVLLSELAQASDAVLVADKMIANLGAPYYIGEHMTRLTVSIGISIFPDDGKDAAELIELADKAMYRAKKHGVGSFVFHGEESVSQQTLQLPALVLPGQQPEVSTLSEHERRESQLREANQRLILAALNSQALQEAAERLVEKLLGLRSEAAASKALDSTVVAVDTVVRAAIRTCRPAIDLRLQQLDVQLPADALEVHGDLVCLTQIVGSLLGNASKYTPNGGKLELSVAAAGGTVVIRVVDSGIGITAEALPEIFGSSDNSLRAVRELVHAHGGTVTANSDGKERGSQFTVTLPLAGGVR